MAHANGTNSHCPSTAMAFPGGIHVPTLTFFKNDTRQEIDWEVQEKHFEFLISSGVHGSRYHRPWAYYWYAPLADELTICSCHSRHEWRNRSPGLNREG